MRNFLLLRHLAIQNANALSSPYTIGFPAMTAWMGAVHALQRYLHQQGHTQVNFKKIAVSCHQFELQTYKDRGDFVHSIIGTSNPLEKNGERPAFIEEARCHLDVSLLVEFQHQLDPNDSETVAELIKNYIPKMKWASGDLFISKKTEIKICYIDEDNDGEVKEMKNKLMPGYVLIERRDLIEKYMANGKDALDSLLDHLKIEHRSITHDDKITWTSKKRKSGWLVPIAVGFQGISDLGTAKNQRDVDTLHRFAESVVTLGEFVMPYRIAKLDDMLWQYHVELEKNLYLCRNQFNS